MHPILGDMTMLELTHCPLPKPIVSSEQVLLDLRALVDFLNQNQPSTNTPVFPRGTIMPDGRLDLCKQSIGMAGAELITAALSHNTNIVSLLLGTNGIGDEGAQHVARLVQKNHCLKVIYLGCNAISDRGIAAIALALQSNDSVTGLWLKRNPIGGAGAVHLAAMLRHNRSIRSLDLVHTQLGDAGLAAILETLISTNRTVERLYLGGNQIGSQHAQQISRLLKENNRLTGLFLNVSRLEDVGAKILADALIQNQTLTDLGLASNGIQNKGCCALIESVTHHKSLRRLDLGYSASTKVLQSQPNYVGDQGAITIAHHLKNNTSLWKLNLFKTGITYQGQAALTAALEANHSLCELVLAAKQCPEIAKLLDRNRLGNSSYRQEFLDSSLIRSVYR
jgi:Ran GTPase-activating protein (RanGAP) involved in mRNA processing and transport